MVLAVPDRAARRSRGIPAAGAGTNLRHYASFYMATSFAWDTFRAVGNAALVLVLGRPLLAALDRAARRMRLDVGPPPAASPVGTVDPASHRVPV